MAIYPRAVYRPLNKFSYVGARPRLGVAFHVNDSGSVRYSPTSLYKWIAGNNGMSCHFQLMSKGIEQYIDTDNGSFCQVDGNTTYISVETQGLGTELMSPYMVNEFGLLMAWLNEIHSIPLQVVDTVGQRGLILHGDGGKAWGGHYSCPGIRGNQRPAILKVAQAIVNPKPVPTPTPTPVEEDEMKFVQATDDTIYCALSDGTIFEVSDTDRGVLANAYGVSSTPVAAKTNTGTVTSARNLIIKAKQGQ